MFVGVGAGRIRNLFKAARENAPSIIFIDEIDSLATKRQSFHASKTRATLNQFLSEMDGFNQLDNVVVVGATNLKDSLDKAFLRPGRFDKIINVSLPDVEGREAILGYYIDKISADGTVDKNIIARATTGLSGAHLKNITNLAILNAIKQKRESGASMEDFEYAIDRVRMGVGRTQLYIEDKDKLMTAYHEGGHTLVALLTEGASPLHKVTILPRGQALGFTSLFPEKDQSTQSRRQMLAFLDVALGGRIAEEMFYGNDKITTGCSSDLNRATQIAYSYVRGFGMDEEIGPCSGDKDTFSDHQNFKIDQKVQQLLKQSMNRTKKLLNDNKSKLDLLAKQLVRRETMDAREVKRLLDL